MIGQRKKKRKAQKKRCLNKQKWEVFDRRMNGKEFVNMSEINSMVRRRKVVKCRGKILGKKTEDGWLMMLG